MNYSGITKANPIRSAALRGLAVASIFFFTSCVPGNMMGAFTKLDGATLRVIQVNLGEVGGSGFEVFSTTVMAAMTQAKCTSCHGSQSPLITSSNMETAYANSKQRMNFEAVADSSLYLKARNVAHCAPTCIDLGATAWQEAMGAWAAAEAAGGGGDDGGVFDPGPADDSVFKTAAITLTGANGARSVAVSVPGSALTGMSLKFDLEVTVAGNSSAARISNLKFSNASGKAILVENIRILQGTTPTLVIGDQSLESGTIFSDVSKVVPTGSDTALSINSAGLNKAQGQYLVFAFNKLEVSANTGCAQQDLFNSLVNLTMQTKCIVCHGNGAGGDWKMSTNSETLCVQALQRVNLGAPMSSKMVDYPLNGANGHAKILTQPEADNFINWITAE